MTAVHNFGTKQTYILNQIVAMTNDALDTDIGPEYIKCSFDAYVHNTVAGYSPFYEATGWESQISFGECVEFMYESDRTG